MVKQLVFLEEIPPWWESSYLKAFELGEMEPGRYADCIFNVILVRKPNVETHTCG